VRTTSHFCIWDISLGLLAPQQCNFVPFHYSYARSTIIERERYSKSYFAFFFFWSTLSHQAKHSLERILQFFIIFYVSFALKCVLSSSPTLKFHQSFPTVCTLWAYSIFSVASPPHSPIALSPSIRIVSLMFLKN
jgi:hypothetical protein